MKLVLKVYPKISLIFFGLILVISCWKSICIKYFKRLRRNSLTPICQLFYFIINRLSYLNMEEDNADDIIKWLFKDTTKLDCQGNVWMRIEEGARQIRWEARLRGNLLALKPIELVAEPMLFVCEKLCISKCENAMDLCLKLKSSKELRMTFQDEKELDKWTIKLSICSHRIAQAEYDQILTTHFSHSTENDNAKMTLFGYFLTSPILREQSFSLFQSANVPNKQIKCTEIMYESKLSMLVPSQMIKLSTQWTTELRDELLAKLWRIRNSAMVDTLHMVVRHLNSNIEIHTQATEFLDSYSGPSFRLSTEKYRVSFLYVPINLHAQFFAIDDKRIGHFLTTGALAALPLRFSGGGLYKLSNKFGTNLTPNSVDHTNEARFHARRQILHSLKRKIGELTRRIDLDWQIDNKIDRILVELISETKQLRETIVDFINTFPNIHNLVDSLCAGGAAQMQHTTGETVPRDTLANQLEFLEVQFDIVNSKIAAIGVDKASKHSAEERKSCGENIRTNFHLTLDVVHHLALSLESAQMLSLIQCLRNRNDCQLFFHLQLRHDALLSQAITITVNTLLMEIYNFNKESDEDELLKWATNDPLITCFAFLSCYGDEQGMLEDSFEIWQLFPKITSFRFISANSSISQICIPQIEGFRSEIKISIPLHPNSLKCLPAKFASGQWFSTKIIFWNLGINHEASLAASVGDISLEELVNRTALKQITEYVLTIQNAEESSDNSNGETINRLLYDLQQTVAKSASRKNTDIFKLTMGLNNALGGMCLLSCKSGKDRTSMAITLEEGRILKETCGISTKQMLEIVECLRMKGVRRENCRKNIGKPLYSFSPFQMNFLPKEFRPPLGTFSNMIAS